MNKHLLTSSMLIATLSASMLEAQSTPKSLGYAQSQAKPLYSYKLRIPLSEKLLLDPYKYSSASAATGTQGIPSYLMLPLNDVRDVSFTSPLYAYQYFAKQIGSNTVYFYIRLQTLEVNTFKKQMKLQLTVGHQLCSEDVFMSGVYNPACYYSWGSDIQKQAQDYIREAPLEVLSNFIQNQKYIDIQMTRTQ